MITHKIYGAGLFLVAALIFASTFSSQYAGEPLGGDVSTVFLPRAYLIAWMLFSALVFLMGFRRGQETDYPNVDWVRLASLSLVCAVAAWAMLTVGFLIALIPSVWAFIWIFGYRKLLPVTIFSVAAPIFVWFLFIHVFELLLPSSPWFHSF